MIEHIPELTAAGIDSFKIEGRAKSAYYTAVITNAYRAAIDAYMCSESCSFVLPRWILDEVRKVSYRDYCTGFYFDSPHEKANISFEAVTAVSGMLWRWSRIAATVLFTANSEINSLRATLSKASSRGKSRRALS